MFNSNHYVPILRSKGAEKGALKDIYEKDRNHITPLIEYIMPQVTESDKKKSPGESDIQISKKKFLSNISNEMEFMAKYWGNSPFLIDIRLIDSEIRAIALERMLTIAKRSNLFLVPSVAIIPIVGFDTDTRVRTIVADYTKETGNGFCIRVTRSHLMDNDLRKSILDFIQRNNLTLKDIDLLVDFGIVVEEESLAYGEFCNRIKEMIPNLPEWRTFTIAGGSFPRDLTDIEQHTDHNLKRYDRIFWREISGCLERKPTFSDYTIQHPIHYEPVIGANVSASVRYALDDRWLIKRGEGAMNKDGAGFKQYLSHAKLLVGDKSVFSGQDFSAGDRYIFEKSQEDIEKGKSGNPKTWLQAGISHHIALTARQVANLL